MPKRPSATFPKLPASLAAERRGDVAILRLSRPQKRNALDDATMLGIETLLRRRCPTASRPSCCTARATHFSAGLDLGELTERDVAEGDRSIRACGTACSTQIEFGKVPVVAVLHGAVVGGGLELAAAAHIRVAERSAYYALPEGSRGIYVGGGGSVRTAAADRRRRA